MVYAGIVAGGTGSRMQADIAKQFIEVLGKPVIAYTVESFAGKVDKICIACHKDYINHAEKIFSEYSEESVVVIEGGKDRMESVMALVEYFKSTGASDEDIILTHDGVRPFVSEKMIEESIENARNGHFCSVAIGATDTVCISENGDTIDSVPDRKKIFNIQTPQTFTFGKLAEIMGKCKNPGQYTDLCGLAIQMGERIKIIEGSAENIKITVPADLKFAETVIKGECPL